MENFEFAELPETLAGVSERTDVPEQYRWALTDLYPSITAWKQHKEEIIIKIKEVVQYKGRLGHNADTLLAALTAYFAIKKALDKFATYAHLLSDEDLRLAEHQALTQEAQHLNTLFEEHTAYIVPELLNISSEMVRQYIQAQPQLEEFSMFLQDFQRRREHILSEREEQLLASAGVITASVSHIRSIFHNAEMPYPEVTLSTGETVALTAANYAKYRSSPVREDRQVVFNGFLETHNTFKNTLGANLTAKLRSDHFYAKNRRYASCLEAALDSDNIPVTVYKNLIAQIHNSLPTLHRFLTLKKRLLEVETLHYYDVYASVAQNVKFQFTIEEAQQLILDALQPLGKDYVNTLQHGFAQRWIDYIPTRGKRSGAYSNGSAYDVHPYILMNWNGDYESLSSLAHEIGHTMHSYFSNTMQPFAKSDYSIFVAEIASTLNENLLSNYLINQTASEEEKLFLLGRYLEGRRGTIFRQTLFAEFEWETHKKIENGDALTGETLSDLYHQLVQRYYGHAQGVCVVDPEIAYEWAFIPHFYYNFYVYKYATSLIYSTALAEKIIQEGESAVEQYFTLLKGGGSTYPLDLIRDTGLDPLSSEAFELTMNKMNMVMDQIESIED